jgi:hypothetical protein
MIYFCSLSIITLISYPILIKFKNGRKVYCGLIAVLIVLLFCLRSKYVGNVDVPRFVGSFEKLSAMTIEQVYIAHKDKDVVFYLISKLLSLVFPYYNIWFLAIGSLFAYSTSKIIYRYSKAPYLAYYVLFALYFVLNFSLLRHTCALSLLLLAYCYLKEEKIVKYFIFVGIAASFHLSSIVFLLIYFVRNLNINWKQFIVIGSAFFISLSSSNIIEKIIYLSGVERFSNYTSDSVMTLNLTSFYIHLVIFLITYILYYLYVRNKTDYIILFNLAMLGLCSYAFVNVIAEFYRMGMYFSIFNVILLPNIICEIKEMNIKIIVILIAVIVMLARFWFSLPGSPLIPYQFFWQT